jgi:hypothetical protein
MSDPEHHPPVHDEPNESPIPGLPSLLKAMIRILDTKHQTRNMKHNMNSTSCEFIIIDRYKMWF